MARNALGPLDNDLKFDVVGPTVDDDVRRLIWRYGAESVKAAVKQATKPKRGRKPEKDWPELQDWIELDLQDWLAGKDPINERSNYSIAKEFAERNPGQSAISTHKRIERKLKSKRQFFIIALALRESEHGPYETYLRAMREYCTVCGEQYRASQESFLARKEAALAEYEAKYSQKPSPDLTMDEIESANRNALMTLPQAKNSLLGRYLSQDNAGD